MKRVSKAACLPLDTRGLRRRSSVAACWHSPCDPHSPQRASGDFVAESGAARDERFAEMSAETLPRGRPSASRLREAVRERLRAGSPRGRREVLRARRLHLEDAPAAQEAVVAEGVRPSDVFECRRPRRSTSRAPPSLSVCVCVCPEQRQQQSRLKPSRPRRRRKRTRPATAVRHP